MSLTSVSNGTAVSSVIEVADPTDGLGLDDWSDLRRPPLTLDSARLWFRVIVAPCLLVACAGAMFHRAFDFTDLFVASAAAIVLGGIAGTLVTRWRPSSPVVATLATPVILLLAAVVGVMVTGRTTLHLSVVPDAINTFLLVGLPAPGLDQLSIVVFVVLFPAMVLAVWASFRDRTLITLIGPLVAMVLAGLLVAPVGSSPFLPALFVLVSAGVLMVDVRNDLSSLPPLLGTGTELRRQPVLFRAWFQLVPTMVAVAVVVTLVPLPETFDLRRFVTPETVRVEDTNPLAVAARWRELDDPKPTLSVGVEGASPGRLRVAVLDGYSDVGWEQTGEFQITGDRFAADPLYPDGTRVSGAALPPTSTVTVEPADAQRSFRSLPTAGTPISTDNPVGLRYSPGPNLIYAEDPGSSITYRTAATAAAPPVSDEPSLASYPAELADCPDAPGLRAVASQLTGGVVSALSRIQVIEDFLLTRRIYDPMAPGGQTLGSVEQFMAQPFARGNLEMFVTSYALLARCAGVPARVVVGYPSPAGQSTYDQSDISAWVETPLDSTGWVPFDPLPTPEEQRLQAQLATSPPPPAIPPTADNSPALREVTPQTIEDAGFPWWAVIVAVIILAIVLAWVLVVPALIRRRRRRLADPTVAVLAAWQTVSEALIDRGVAVGAFHTPSEVIRVCAGRVPVSVPALIAGMAPIVDRVRYGGRAAANPDAAVSWAYAAAIGERLPMSLSMRCFALLHPVHTLRRLRSCLGSTLRPAIWDTVLPDTAMISSASAPIDIPDVSIDSRIGDGTTGSVYRGVHVPTGERVAIKVFRYGPADPGFDQHRFEWEVRIAREVSGLAHLPRVIDAGIAPVSGRPYLVSTLFEDGTLLDRVRNGGPLTRAQALALGGDLSVALDALHQLGVVHADVKPENVFAHADGWVLGDLGSAWLRTGHGPAASVTPPYAAPEVWRGAAPTPASDLYSLSLTMLYAATGQVPVAGNSPAADDVVAAFPDEPVLLRALDPDARRRPRSIAEIGRRLRPGRFGTVVGGPASILGLPTPTVTHPRG